MVGKYLKHIPTQCSYEILDEDDTIEICGTLLRPKADEVVWEYCDEKLTKEPIYIDPFNCN